MAKYNCYCVDKDDNNLKVLIERINNSCDGVTSLYYEFSIKTTVGPCNRKVNSINIKAISNPVDYIYQHFSSKSLEESKLSEEECKRIVEIARIKTQVYKDSGQNKVKNSSPIFNAKRIKVYPSFVKLFINEKDPVLVEDDRYNNSKALLRSLRSDYTTRRNR